ncbi:MAG: molybdenum cofactor cytidylyltransferase [Thermomicrobiales bacterium]|nr:molybdenum cofactor cytidylyltransferase [Thermomicrobiales bacterium]
MLPRAGISGVILAAGRSSRLGRPKQLLELDGQPLLTHVVRNAVASDLDEVLLVLGHQAAEIESAVGEWGHRIAVNLNYAEGQSTSVRVGLGAVDPLAEAVVFLLGDQPQVGPEIIDALIVRFRQTGAPIVMPTYGGIAANPVLFARDLFPELARVSGDEGARTVVKQHRHQVTEVSVSDGPPPRDVDTEADYKELLAEMSPT